MAASNTVVNTNIMALNTHRSLKNVGNTQAKASERLSSGLRINSAADDAAGLAISEKMRAQIRGLDMASKNSQDAISLIQTAEGGMQEIDNMLQRIRELIVQAANDTNEYTESSTTADLGDRQKIQDEIDSLITEIDSMSERVEFNKKKLIDGSYRTVIKGELDPLDSAYAAAFLASQAADADVVTATTNKDAAVKALEALDGVMTTDEANQGLVDALTTLKNMVDAVMDKVDVLDPGGTLGLRAAIESGFEILGSLNSIDLFDLASTWATGEDDYDNVFVNDGTVAGKQAALAALKTAIEDALVTTNFGGSGVDLTDVVGDYGTTANLEDATVVQIEFDAFFDSGVWKNAFANLNDALEVNKIPYQIAVDETQVVLDAATAAAVAAAANLKAATKAATSADVYEGGLYFQVGANADQGWVMTIGSVKSDILGIGDGNGNSTIDVLDATGEGPMSALLNTLDDALTYVTSERSKLGAAQNRLEYTIKSLDISSENLSSAESRIRDTDMAKEMMNYTQANVLQQAAISMLAQANQAPQNLLTLLR